MTSDFEKAKTALLARAREVAKGEPSQQAFYALEKEVEYSSHWCDAREQLLATWTQQGSREEWQTALLTTPPDLNLLIDRFDRSRTSVDWEHEKEAWLAEGRDRMYGRPRPARTSDAFAAHIKLLHSFDPASAADYVAGLPSGGLVWAGAFFSDLWRDVEEVEGLVANAGGAAADLVLAGLFEAIEGQCRQAVRDQQDDPFTITNEEHERAVEKEVQRFAPGWLEAVCDAVLSRSDAAAVIGPWLRYLVSTADGSRGQRNHHASLASLALGQLEQALADLAVSIEIPPLTRTSPKCVLARMFSRQAQSQDSADLWHEWTELLLDEEVSLLGCGQLAWNLVAGSLLDTGSATTEWTSSLVRLQPLFRQYERSPSHRPTACNLFLPGAIVAVRQVDRDLWLKVFEQARRYALVCCPPPSEYLEYRLPALVAQLYPRVFQSNTVSKEILVLLPTDEHRQWATEIGR